MFTTNLNANASFGISDNENMLDGLEFAGAGNPGDPYEFDRGWSIPDIRLAFLENLAITGVFSGDGSRLTNLTASAAAPTITYTNFISGRPYTNATGRPQFASSPVRLATANVNGNALVALVVDTAGGVNFNVLLPTSIVGQTTVTTTSNIFFYGTLTGFIPIGSSYVITNLCTGTGNALVVLGTNSLIQY